MMDLAQASDADILTIVDLIMDNLMAASTAIDYDRHTQDFTAWAKGMLSREALRLICEHYPASKGCFAKREFVSLFRRPDSIAVIWRQWFTQAAGEFVAEVVLVEQDGRYRVDHAMVF